MLFLYNFIFYTENHGCNKSLYLQIELLKIKDKKHYTKADRKADDEKSFQGLADFLAKMFC